MPQTDKNRSCLIPTLWLVLLSLVVILVVFFVLTSIFDLGVWDEFWDMIREKHG